MSIQLNENETEALTGFLKAITPGNDFGYKDEVAQHLKTLNPKQMSIYTLGLKKKGILETVDTKTEEGKKRVQYYINFDVLENSNINWLELTETKTKAKTKKEKKPKTVKVRVEMANTKVTFPDTLEDRAAVLKFCRELRDKARADKMEMETGTETE